MTDRRVEHANFTIERAYAASPERVFTAWAEEKAKADWFAGGGDDYRLDFRVGGREVNRGSQGGGPVITFDARYHEIVPPERIVYAYDLYVGSTLASVSVTTVQFAPADGGTRLELTEQVAFLDGHDRPEWREQGTRDWLETLAAHLERETSRA
ncbi:polyketide cyclase [Microbispora cellulosiformans]|uniref:Polyketide cyclase n=1 Tax=Microbispora cellulosiformans TaxID=2614688 RepID=A0A5J5K217_9ACTN|nr:SRPBCC family protein [Microbispora cellulosiformans]KAA9377591.1 polyketide cyclase [Microbispora cellulosiformans]